MAPGGEYGHIAKPTTGESLHLLPGK